MSTLRVIVQRTSIYEREVGALPTDDDELLDFVMDAAAGDEIDGTTDRVSAWLDDREVL